MPARTPKARKATKKTATKTRRPAKKTASQSQYDKVANAVTTVTPYLAVNDAKAAIEWYGKVFGAKKFGGEPMLTPDGKVMHANLKIGNGIVFVSDILPQSDLVDATRAGASVNLNLFHKDADKFWERAVANGAKVTMPIDDMFWGDRYGRIIDPFGHSWAISRKSKLSAKALAAKQAEAMKQTGMG